MFTFIHEILSHPGIEKTYNTLKKFFYIYNLKSKLTNNISECIDCQKNKPHKLNQGKLNGFIEADYKRHKLCTDIYGPFSLDEFQDIGVGYFVTITDIFTRYLKLVLVRNITGESLADVFRKLWQDKPLYQPYFYPTMEDNIHLHK